MADKAKPNWAFLTNHGTVLLSLVSNPSMEIGELAQLVGVGGQAAQEIVADLVAEGYLVPTQEDGRNGYAINGTAHLRIRCSIRRDRPARGRPARTRRVLTTCAHAVPPQEAYNGRGLIGVPSLTGLLGPCAGSAGRCPRLHISTKRRTIVMPTVLRMVIDTVTKRVGCKRVTS